MSNLKQGLLENDQGGGAISGGETAALALPYPRHESYVTFTLERNGNKGEREEVINFHFIPLSTSLKFIHNLYSRIAQTRFFRGCL